MVQGVNGIASRQLFSSEGQNAEFSFLGSRGGIFFLSERTGDSGTGGLAPVDSKVDDGLAPQEEFIAFVGFGQN